MQKWALWLRDSVTSTTNHQESFHRTINAAVRSRTRKFGFIRSLHTLLSKACEKRAKWQSYAGRNLDEAFRKVQQAKTDGTETQCSCRGSLETARRWEIEAIPFPCVHVRSNIRNQMFRSFKEAVVERLASVDAGIEDSLENKIETAKEWYNGYKFGEISIMNPWSILNYVDKLRANPDRFPECFWANTSGNDLVRTLINTLDEKNLDDAKADVEKLMSGGTLKMPIDVNVTYVDIDGNVSNIWNLLFFTGYLTQISCEQIGIKVFYELKIPNLEVKNIYDSIISSWFEKVMTSRNMNKFYEAIMNADVQTVTDEINDVLMRSISYMDYAEAFYHGIMIGMFSTLSGYRVESNRETGKGRSDIILRPLIRSKTAVIIELKATKKYREREKIAREALEQIERNQYDSALRENGYEKILKYGIVFIEKECFIMVNDQRTQSRQRKTVGVFIKLVCSRD